jgi:hypothetical protein
MGQHEVQYYRQLIGVLRWAVEIGRVGILLETSLLSSYLALPQDPKIDENRFWKCDWTDLTEMQRRRFLVLCHLPVVMTCLLIVFWMLTTPATLKRGGPNLGFCYFSIEPLLFGTASGRIRWKRQSLTPRSMQ